MVNFTKHNALVGRIKKCFNDPSICDVTVYGPSNDVYHCLRFNLCMSSGVFKQMLTGENSKELYLHDVDCGALGHLLTFLHTGECEVTDENIIPLSAAAEMFEVDDLIDVCNTYKTKHLNINEKNCCYLLEDAVDFGARDIEDECKEFITRNMDLVCARTEFLLMDFDIVQGIGVHAEENLFKSQERDVGHMCLWLVLGLIKWMERDLPHREVFKMDLLWNLDLAPLSPEQMAHICRCDIIRRSPELSMSVIDALAGMCDTNVQRATNPKDRLKTFQSQGVWESWIVDSSGWYTIVARDAHNGKPPHVKIYRGLSSKIENDDSYGGGGFYFHIGDEVRAMVGAGSSPSCVIVRSSRTGKDRMVLVGGGDVSMVLSSDDEAGKTSHFTTSEKKEHPLNMVPQDPLEPIPQYDDYDHAYYESSSQVATSYQNPAQEYSPGRSDKMLWGTIGYPVNSHSNLTFIPSSEGNIHTSASRGMEQGDDGHLIEEPSFKMFTPEIRSKSKKKFPRVDSTKVRKKWKKFVDVVRDL